MKLLRTALSLHLAAIFTLLLGTSAVAAEAPSRSSQEISEKEGIPVLVKHLPDWERKAESSIFVTSRAELQTYLNDRQVLNTFDFLPGTEAVIASYPEGKLVIVEFATPQASADADQRVASFLENAQSGTEFFYRRIGNYNVFLFDGSDEAAANALFDQIKYEKVVQWLGAPPFYGPEGETEREFIVRASSLFIGTVVIIIGGFSISAVIGVIVGLLYFLFRERRRAGMTSFSDFGGLTRLNLDGLAADPARGRLLGE